MPTTSVIYATMPTEIGSVASYARLAESTSGRRLWAGQSLTIETHHLFAALTGMGFDIGFGSAVTLMPMRHPLTAALNARSIAALSGRPFIAGIGPGAAALQRSMLGPPYRAPVTATRHYATRMRALLDGKVADEPENPWRTGELQLPPMADSPVQIGLGVLRQPMARLAGEMADWAITWLTPSGYVRDRLLPTVASSARQADRPAPRLAAVVHCVVDRRRRDVLRLAYHSAAAHLSAPHYTDMLNQAGVPVDPADPHAGASMLVRHGVIATGSPDEIAAALGDYHAAGVDEVIVSVGGVHLVEGPGAALRDLAEILTAIEGRDPR
ncbi:LLM class flavin-dependent oxidoreductase [Streptomyces sp. NPDC048506]|uniref:LLM class flavin-dependent oxidoreductase n=1 Tax=Streptomyces sp. NPDC048506 TaxID=3155028 RepID=UPI003432D233